MALKFWGNGEPIGAAFDNGALLHWYLGEPLGVIAVQSGTVSPDSIDSAESWGGPELQQDQDVAPDSIESEESWGAPDVEIEGLNPDSIDSEESWGTPVIIPDGLILAASIGTQESWGTPNVAGPCNPDSILTAESWGTPVLNVEQDVTPTSIATAESWGSPRVSNVETVSPATITSEEAWGSPVLSQSVRPIFAASILSSESWGAPDVGGGTATLQVFVGNYDRSRWQLRPGGINLTQRTLGRWTGTAIFQNCPVRDADGVLDMTALDTVNEFVPAFGMTVLIKEFGRTLFRGCIREVEAKRHPGTNLCVYTCQLADKGTLCERRVVTKYYPAASEPDAVQWDMADVIRDIVTNFLNGEGIDVDPDLPATLGLLSAPIQQYITVAQAFDQLRDLLGYAGWFIDLTQTLVFTEVTGVEDAPFELLETELRWRELSVRVTDQDYRNRQYVMSNRKLIPGDDGVPSNAETYELLRWGDRPNAAIQPSIYDDEGGYQRRVFDEGFPPYFYFTEFGIDRIISAKLNGVEVTVLKSDEMTFEQWDEFRSGTERVWAYDGNGSSLVIFPSLFSDPHTPLNSPGDIIEITYLPSSASSQTGTAQSDVFSVEEPIEPLPGEKFGTCGSGRYEHVEQVNDVFTREAGQALAAGLLARSGGIPKIVSFETDVPGFQVGQRIYANIPRNLLSDEEMFVTELEGTSLEGTDLGQQSSFRWRISASNRPDVGSWLKTWQRLWRRTQHPTPLPRIAPTTIILGSGRSLRSGEEMNPGKIDETGQLVDVVAVFLDPPEDQDLVIDVRLDGVSIFSSAKLVIPAGETGDVRPEALAQTPLYAFKDQTVTVNISYRVTGANPVAARNGSVKLRWDV